MKVNEMKEPLYLTIEAVRMKDPSIEKFTFSKNPGHEPLHSIHTEDHKIIWLDE